MSRPRSFGTSTDTPTPAGTSIRAQHLGRVGQLRDHVGTDEARDLQATQPGPGQRIDQLDLGLGGDDLRLVLEPVARAHLPDPHAARKLSLWAAHHIDRPPLTFSV